jgi:hypothetical protein
MGWVRGFVRIECFRNNNSAFARQTVKLPQQPLRLASVAEQPKVVAKQDDSIESRRTQSTDVLDAKNLGVLHTPLPAYPNRNR